MVFTTEIPPIAVAADEIASEAFEAESVAVLVKLPVVPVGNVVTSSVPPVAGAIVPMFHCTLPLLPEIGDVVALGEAE